MGGADAAGDRGALSRLRVGRGRRVSAAVTSGGGEVEAGAVPACGVAPPAGGVPGDVDADFHHQFGFHQRDDKFFLAAPSGGERPACPRMTEPRCSEWAGDRSTCRLGEGGGAADVLKASLSVVPAEQQRAGAAREPVIALTITSLVSRSLYFCQPLADGR